jgi:hypothetical protein
MRSTIKWSSIKEVARHVKPYASFTALRSVKGRFDTQARGWSWLIHRDPRGTNVEDTGWCEAGESSLELKSTVGHGKAPHVLSVSWKALKKFTFFQPSERANKKIGMPGRPTRAGSEGESAALLLDTPRSQHRFRIRCRRIRCCAVTTLAYGLAPR